MAAFFFLNFKCYTKYQYDCPRKARDVLLEAGLDEEALKHLREAAKAAHQAMYDAVADEDYEAFKDAIEGTPLSDIITTEADFKQFVKAHQLRKSGEHDEAKKSLLNSECQSAVKVVATGLVAVKSWPI